MSTVLVFWKEVGGYQTCIKWRGRWYYAHRDAGEHMRCFGVLKAAGYGLQRVQGMPRALNAIWSEHGATVGALKEHLPLFNVNEVKARAALAGEGTGDGRNA